MGPVSDGPDGLPPEYAPQILHQLVATGSSRDLSPPISAGRRRESAHLRNRPVARDAGCLRAAPAVEWWQKHVVGMVPPSQDKPL